MQTGGKSQGRVPALNFEEGTPSTALYVGDLDKSLNEAFLYQLFQKIGPIGSIRVCRDSVTRRSLGYAYVNFNTSLDTQTAMKAMEVLNYTPIMGRPIRIMKAQRDPSARKSGVGNVFVKGLDNDIDSRTLHDTFEVFGAITSAKVALDDHLAPLGYGYVQYETPEAAQAAVERANGMLLKGKQLHVAPYKSKTQRDMNRGFTNVYCKNLPESVVDEESLKSLFAGYGTITSVYLARDELGSLKGFGFVNFEETSMALAAIDDLNDKEMEEGKKLYVGPAQKKGIRQRILKDRFEQIKRERQQNSQGKNIYLKQFSLEYTSTDLHKLFEQFGVITSAKVMTDDTGRSRGFGFVCFETSESANEAIKEMNGKLIEGKNLYVAIHQNKEARMAELSRQRMNVNYGMGGMNFSPYPHMMPPNMVPPAGIWPMMGSNQPGGYQPVQEYKRSTRPRPGAIRRGGRSAGGGGGGRGGAHMRGYEYGQQPMPGFMPAPFQFNMGPPPPPPQQQPPPQPQPPIVNNPPAAIPPPVQTPGSPRQEKVFLGERLYPAVHTLQPARAAKITGMLLEMENNEIQVLLQDPNALANRVKEAVQVLEEHGVQEDE